MNNFWKNQTNIPTGYSDLLEELEAKERAAMRPRNKYPKVVREKTFVNYLHNRPNYDDYLFRCSGWGKLMGGIPKPLTDRQAETYSAYHERFMGNGKPLTEKQESDYYDLGARLRAKATLSDGAVSYCSELVREDVFGRRKIIETKYMDKGIEMESASIELYGSYIGESLVKNTERKQNEYIIGEADNVSHNIVRDFKTSWDHSTFPIADRDIKNNIYAWQLQGYMDLWELEKAELVYCLVDTPVRLVEDVIRRLDWDYNILTNEGAVREQHRSLVVEKVCNMIYTYEGLIDLLEQSGTLEADWFENVFVEIPVEDRIKVFKVDRNDKMLRQGKEVLKLARNYMNQSLNLIKTERINGL